MSFLERAIRKGVSDAIGKAVGNAVQKAVEPKATELANRAAGQIDQAARTSVPQTPQTSNLDGALSNLQRSMENYATEAAKNLKVCPKCGRSATADQKFCPDCGSTLPERTLAQGAVCTSCGKQNTVGTKFCAGCGAKLPAAIEEEQEIARQDAAVLEEWAQKLPQYPKWNSGQNYVLEFDGEYAWFSATYPSHIEAKNAVAQYQSLLQSNGFHTAGQYPEIVNLYKRINGVIYHINTGMCFEGDPETPTIYFDHTEPIGGYDYVKPEPKKKTSFFDLFK